SSFFFFQAEDGIRDFHVTGVQTCALPISARGRTPPRAFPPGLPAGPPRWNRAGRTGTGCLVLSKCAAGLVRRSRLLLPEDSIIGRRPTVARPWPPAAPAIPATG